jgi:U3 small nucleolar RNA-associated protein 7
MSSNVDNDSKASGGKKKGDGNTMGVARGDSRLDSKRKREELLTHVVPNLDDKTKEKYHRYMGEHKLTKKEIKKFHGNKEEDFVKTLDPHKQRAMERRQQGNKQSQSLAVERLEAKRTQAAVEAAMASSVLETTSGGTLVEAENVMERTHRLTQHELKTKHLDENTARHIYDLDLTEGYGPYGLEYDGSGRHSIMYGTTGGHVAMMDNHTQSLVCEFHLNEPVHSATALHNHTLFALAQQKHVYIYDDNGSEVHHCQNLRDPLAVEFLAHHWLLACTNRLGSLYFQDTSTGQQIAELRTRSGPCRSLKQNPQTGVVHCGHGNGSVTLWTPVSHQYLIKMQCHRGPVLSLAVDPAGKYMVTSGADKLVKVWDLRTYKCLNQKRMINKQPGHTIDISQKNGIVGIGHGYMSTFWQGAFTKSVEAQRDYDNGVVKEWAPPRLEPYMQHKLKNGRRIESLRFRPFEDVCGLGHSGGVSSIVIPGSGEPNLDSVENGGASNPFADNKQRREMEVRGLMDKLPPHTISLEGSTMVGRVQRSRDREIAMLEDQMDDANTRVGEKKKEKNKARGRNKLGKKLEKKQQNVVDKTVMKIREKAEEDKKEDSATQEREEYLKSQKEKKREEAPAALKRFFS